MVETHKIMRPDATIITQQLIDIIAGFEGFSPLPYRDAGGLWTIGYGHLIRKGEVWESLAEDEARELLRHDVMQVVQQVKNLIHVPLWESQWVALISFTFNLGGGALERSTLRQKVNREEHIDVPKEFMKWVWCRGMKIQGLIRRRRTESLLYLSRI